MTKRITFFNILHECNGYCKHHSNSYHTKHVGLHEHIRNRIKKKIL